MATHGTIANHVDGAEKVGIFKVDGRKYHLFNKVTAMLLTSHVSNHKLYRWKRVEASRQLRT
jgi:hypothetical protein